MRASYSARLRGRVASLDANGDAEATIPLNDSLASWIVRLQMPGELFGTGSTNAATTQDLLPLARLPPVVREGDQTGDVRCAHHRRRLGERRGKAPRRRFRRTGPTTVGHCCRAARHRSGDAHAARARWPGTSRSKPAAAR